MRRVFRNRTREPEVLRGEWILQARIDLADYYRIPEIDRHRRRAPVDRKLLASREITEALSAVFFSKCAYCEVLLENGVFSAVSHYRPIGNAAGIGSVPQDDASPDHYGWLAYEWQNLFLSCPECDRAQRNLFPLKGPRARLRSTWKEVEASEQPLLINPCRVEPRKHLTFSMAGGAFPKDEVGRVTIDVFALNRTDLVQARANKFAVCLDALVKMRDDPGQLERLRMELDVAAPFAGSAQIALFDLIVDWCRTMALSKPTFKNIADDAARLAVVATQTHWDTLNFLAMESEPAIERQIQPILLAEMNIRPIRTLKKPRTSQLKTIHIKNFKGVRELRLEVAPIKRGDVGAPCMMLLGENSTGKSSTLQAIALALMGDQLRARIGVDAEDFIPREDTGWQIDESALTEITLEFDTGEPVRLQINPASKEFIGAADASFKLFAYGSRRFFDQELRRMQPASSVKSLFNPFTKIQHPGRWLQQLTDKQFDAVARAIRPVLVLQEEDRIERDAGGRLFVHAHGRDTPLERLSDGYRSLMAMVLDVMRGMLEEWGDLYDASGIVLIDEIETHLHPRWKLHIVSALRQAMPNVQFIATTHDPLCLRGMRTGEVEVLVRNGEHCIEALKGLPDVRGLRAEQLLTSEYFGLASTADPDLERALNDVVQPTFDGTRDDAARTALLSFQWIGNTLPQQIANEATRRLVDAVATEPSIDRSQVREAAVSEVLARLRSLRAGGQG